MPTVLRIDGNRFFFFSNEGDEPPHVHVETAESAAKFWLDPVALAKSYRYTSRELSTLRRLVEGNRESVLESWHEHFSSQ